MKPTSTAQTESDIDAYEHHAYSNFTTANIPNSNHTSTSSYASSPASHPYSYGDFQRPSPRSFADYTRNARITADSFSMRRDEIPYPPQTLQLPPLREILAQSQSYTIPTARSRLTPIEPKICYQSQSCCAQHVANFSCQHRGGPPSCHGGHSYRIMTDEQRD